MSDTPVFDELAKQFSIYGIRVEELLNQPKPVVVTMADAELMLLEAVVATVEARKAAEAAQASAWIQSLCRAATM